MAQKQPKPKAAKQQKPSVDRKAMTSPVQSKPVTKKVVKKAPVKKPINVPPPFIVPAPVTPPSPPVRETPPAEVAPEAVEPASRHDNVTFRFSGRQADSYLPGTVLFRNGTMVLDIREGDTPYLIEGGPSGHWFEGTNANRVGFAEVRAKWALVGATYVGTWIEDGTMYLFSFDVSVG